jgi:hypothetical protein
METSPPNGSLHSRAIDDDLLTLMGRYNENIRQAVVDFFLFLLLN